MEFEAEQIPRSPARPTDVAGATFPLIRRGYDPAQVTWFLQGLAEDFAEHEHRIEQLEQELKAATEELKTVHRIDEVTVAHFLGEESARLLTMARDTANDLANRADVKACAVVSTAEAEAATTRREADIDTKRLRKETDAACAAALEQAEDRAARIVADAEAQRRRVLGDLTRRRELAAAQFRDLIAGRDALVRSLTTAENAARALTTDLADFALVPASFVSLADVLQDEPIVENAVTPAIARARAS